MRTLKFFIYLSLILLLASVTELVLPQICAAPAITQEPVLARINTDLVAVDVTVADREGNYLLGLEPGDFEVLEDGIARKIEFFQPTRTLQATPLALVIALDLSGSISAEETILQRQSIRQFIEMLDANSVCGLVSFNYQINVLQELTKDQKKLAKSLEKIKEYGGSTRIYDALDRSITLLKKAPLVQAGKRLRRVIIVVTDGFDSASVIDKKELVERANTNGVSIYSVTLPSYVHTLSQSKQRVPTLLDISRITDNTGGRDFPVLGNNFTDVFQAIAKEISAGYTLAYYPPKDKATQAFHKVEVRVKRTGAVVRVNREGYAASE